MPRLLTARQKSDSPPRMKYSKTDEIVQRWLAGALKIISDHYTSTGLTYARPTLDIQEGPRYLRVVRAEFFRREDGTFSPTATNESAHCFIDRETGDILKTASWKSPEKRNPRGNLADASGGLSMLTPYGVAYMRDLR